MKYRIEAQSGGLDVKREHRPSWIAVIAPALQVLVDLLNVGRTIATTFRQTRKILKL
jgi:hypothetical protein